MGGAFAAEAAPRAPTTSRPDLLAVQPGLDASQESNRARYEGRVHRRRLETGLPEHPVRRGVRLGASERHAEVILTNRDELWSRGGCGIHGFEAPEQLVASGTSPHLGGGRPTGHMKSPGE